MKRERVFISGPIQGMEHDQSYRDRLRRVLTEKGYEPVDPWRREKVVYSTAGEEWWKNVQPAGFIRRDLEDVERCDMLVAYSPKTVGRDLHGNLPRQEMWKKDSRHLRASRPQPVDSRPLRHIAEHPRGIRGVPRKGIIQRTLD